MAAADLTSRSSAAPLSPLGLTGRAYALLGALGATVIAVLRLVIPYSETDSVSSAISKVAADAGREQWVLILGALGVLLLIPGYQALGQLTRAAAPRLTGIGLGLSYVGYLALGMVMLGDQLLLSASRMSSQPAAIDLAERVQSSPFVVAVTVVFVIGHVLGTVLFGVAFLRARSIPMWAAVLVTIAQPMHFFAAIILGNHVLDFFCWVLMAVGFAVAGAVLIRRSA